MNFSTLKQQIEHIPIDIDYKWTNPKSLIIFVPALSLIVEKIQTAKIWPSLPTKDRHLDEFVNNPNLEKYKKLLRWHLLGSATQMITLVALTILSHNFLFAIPLCISSFETLESLRCLVKEPRRRQKIETPYQEPGTLYSVQYHPLIF